MFLRPPGNEKESDQFAIAIKGSVLIVPRQRVPKAGDRAPGIL